MRSAGHATRERILSAAKEEFAQRGPIGARINRIAEQASASKERLYAYFPSKDALFAAVIERLVVDVSQDTAPASGDLATYAGLLFDSYVRNPTNARLHDWLNFDVTDAPDDSPQLLAFRAKVNDIRAAQDIGTIDRGWDPMHLLIMVIDIAKSMAYPKGATRQLLKGNHAAGSRAARRAAAVEAARRLSAPRI